MNAEPNYGTGWFHCRYNSFDSTNQILANALHILSHEFAETQMIYNRAILAYVQTNIQTFVNNYNKTNENENNETNETNEMNELNETNERIKALEIYKNEMKIIEKNIFINFTEKILKNEKLNENNYNSNENLNENLIINEQSLLLQEISNYKLLIFDYNFLIKYLYNNINEWRNKFHINNNNTINMSIIELNNGNIFIATDFITGIIELNRLLFKKSEYLTIEEKRKILFGFDQILS